MSLPSNLYEQAFANSPPKQTVTLLKARLLASENAAEALSRYVEERSAIEGDYAKKLSKLASRPILPDGTGFADIVTQIEAELSSAVQSHSTFASKLEKTVAAPLRDRSRAGAERVKSYAGDANAIANEHDSISQKVAKAASKFGASSKKQAQLASNQDDLSTALAGWLNAAPNYLKAVQHADKARLDAIKENMAKYETLVSDLGRERMETAEQGLLRILSWEPEDDMQTFVLKQGGRVPPRTNNAQAAAPAEDMRQRQNATNLARRDSVASYQRPAESIRSNQSGNRDSSSMKQGGFLSAISTKLKPSMNRNRSSSYGPLDGPAANSIPTRSVPPAQAHPHELSTTDETPLTSNQGMLDPTHSREPTTPLGEEGDSLNPSTPTRSLLPGTNSVGRHREREPAPDRRQSSLPFGLGRRLSVALSSSTSSREAPSMPQAQPVPVPQREELGQTNGSTGRDETTVRARNPFAEVDETPSQAASPTIDAEGYSVPPADYNQAPWTGSLMDEPSSVGSAPRVQIAQQPLQPLHSESPAERDAALERVKSTLLSAGPSAAPRRSSTMRGRRDVRNTIYQPSLGSTDDMPLSMLTTNGSPTQSLSQSPSSFSPMSAIPPSFPNTPTARANGRAGSMLSTTSSRDFVTSPVTNPFDQPDGQGLRASVTETVSVLFKHGQTPRVMITGEVSLLLRGLHAPFSIRISRYEQLEKSAPNSAFLQARPQGEPGEYLVDAGALASAAGPASVLKYHVYVSAERATAMIPLELTPQWKCEANQTLLLINYGVNPACTWTSSSRSPFEEAASLKDLSFLVPITSSNVTNVQSKPTAIFSAEKRRLLWKLDDLPLDNREQHKALVKFAVEEQSQVQPVSVKWKLPGRLVSGVGMELLSSGGQGALTGFEEMLFATQSGKYLVA